MVKIFNLREDLEVLMDLIFELSDSEGGDIEVHLEWNRNNIQDFVFNMGLVDDLSDKDIIQFVKASLGIEDIELKDEIDTIGRIIEIISQEFKGLEPEDLDPR